MNWIAFKRTAIGIIAALGLGCLIAIVLRAGMKDFFGMNLTTKITFALSGIGIIFKWAWDFVKNYLKEIKKEIENKVSISEWKEFKMSEKDRYEEMFSLLTHISERVDMLAQEKTHKK